jgi:hypothetical protein
VTTKTPRSCARMLVAMVLLAWVSSALVLTVCAQDRPDSPGNGQAPGDASGKPDRKSELDAMRPRAQADGKPDQEDPNRQQRAARLRQMRDVAGAIRAYRVTQESREAVEVVAEPVFRFDDPARAYEDGTVWVWGRVGRPIAILELFRNIHSGPGWALALGSLSTGRVRLEGQSRWLWAPEGPGLQLKPLAKAPAPAPQPTARLRQMREIAARCTAYEFWDPDNQRSELRLIRQPLRRYDDPQAGLLDGALFLFCHGTNPEVVLLVEAAGKDGSPTTWQYGIQRLGHAEMHLNLDGREIWQCGRIGNPLPSDPYYLVIVPE